MLSGYVISPDMWKRDMDVECYTIPERLVFDDPDDMEAWRLLNSTRSFTNIRRNLLNWYEFAFSGRKRRERSIQFNRAAWDARKAFAIDRYGPTVSMTAYGENEMAMEFLPLMAGQSYVDSLTIDTSKVLTRASDEARTAEAVEAAELQTQLLKRRPNPMLALMALSSIQEQQTQDKSSKSSRNFQLLGLVDTTLCPDADALTKQKDVETVFRSHVNNMEGSYNALFSDLFTKLTREKVGGK
jgi:hypothetical protein